jgi:CRP/FNR family transcriptional regulator
MTEPVRTSCTVAKTHCNCFEALTDEQRVLLESKQVEVNFKKGETIIKNGAFATHVIFVCEGLVKVYMEEKDDRLILKIMGPGNLIGLSSLNESEAVFQYTASAYQDTVVKFIDIATFKQFIRDNGLFAEKIINILSDNANLINNRFFCLTNRQSYGRLADIMLCLSGRVFKADKFQLDLTRKEIAELAGMSTESVIRILKKFQDEKLIEMNGKIVEIKDSEALHRICSIG